jgi:hypothetical protein
MRKSMSLLGLTFLLILSTRVSPAETIQERLQKFGKSYAQGYLQPFGNAFTASQNSGWFQTANVSNGLDLFIGVKAMLLPIPSDSRSFSFASPANNQVQSIPTLFGDETEVPISGMPAGLTPSNYLKGLNLSWAPMAVPHVSIGNMFGTRLMFRYLPPVKLQDYGDVSLFGVGVQHSISQYFPGVPVDLAAHVAYQKFNVGDIISVKAFNFGAEVSKTLFILTIYGGVEYETATMSISYTGQYDDPVTHAHLVVPIGFDFAGANTFRATAGLGISLGFIKINAEYSAASQPVAVAGIGIGF